MDFLSLLLELLEKVLLTTTRKTGLLSPFLIRRKTLFPFLKSEEKVLFLKTRLLLLNLPRNFLFSLIWESMSELRMMPDPDKRPNDGKKTNDDKMTKDTPSPPLNPNNSRRRKLLTRLLKRPKKISLL